MNKESRHALYKELLDVVCADPSVGGGLCLYIAKRTKYGERKGGFFIQNHDNIIMQDLPELYSMKPVSAEKFWFPSTPKGWERRIALIEKCIELTK